VWGPALLQHYGPGSPFLDVTSDVRLALWFALHQHHERWIRTRLWTDPITRNSKEHCSCTAWYTPLPLHSISSLPVVYVFDVQPWDGRDAGPAHGQVVDLLAPPAPGLLGKAATRIHSQRASLLFADVEDGPDLGPIVHASILLSGEFDRGTSPLGGVSAKRMFPGPDLDPTYKMLIRVPVEWKFEPRRYEHPLGIPFYLTADPCLWESGLVYILDGTGKRESPVRLSLLSESSVASSEWHQELDGYLRLGRRVSPLHPHLVGTIRDQVVPEGLQVGNRLFTLDNATPIILETPLWTTTPSVETPADRGLWIDSALPLGIGDEIDGRQTTNVYVELSPLDYAPAGEEEPSRFCPRAVWLARNGFDYALVYFQVVPDQTPEGCSLFNAQFEFRYDAGTSRFYGKHRGAAGRWTVMGLDLDAEPVWKPALKALFTTLTLLRDLSPGMKPPAVHKWHIVHKDGLTFYLPPYALETQLGTLVGIPSTSYVTPRALCGTAYLHMEMPPSSSADRPEPDEELTALNSFFDRVVDPYYRVYAALTLARLCFERGMHDRAEEVFGLAFSAAESVAVPHFRMVLEMQRGVLLAEVGEAREAQKAITRAKESSQTLGFDEASASCEKMLADLPDIVAALRQGGSRPAAAKDFRS
jgi:hypothetical protein